MVVDETNLPATQSEFDEKALIVEALGLSPERAERFAVIDDKSDSWVVKRIVFWQTTIDNTAAVARAIIQHAVTSRDKLLFLYGAQHRRYVVPKLKTNRKTYEDPLLAGVTWFEKTGGWSVVDNKALTDHVKSLDSGYYTYDQLNRLAIAMRDNREVSAATLESIEYLLAKLNEPHPGVRVKFEPVKAYWKDCVTKGEVVPGYKHNEVQEHGNMYIGTTEKWTLKKSLDRLKATVNKAIGWNPNDDEGESEND